MHRRTRNSSAEGYSDGSYDERLRQLQTRLRDSETRRMELERRMFESSTSDTCKTKLKYKELKKYLEEICERQKKSLLRNQDLLSGFDSIEACIRKFASSSESLQKLKRENERKNQARLDLDLNPALGSDEGGDTMDKMVPEGRQAGINTKTAKSRGVYHTPTIFMGRQMSAVSSIEGFSAPQKSSRLTKGFSISDLHSHRQPSQSSYVTDGCVVQTNSDLQCSNKSDRIDGKTYLLMGREMPVTSNVSHEDGKTFCLTAESKTNNYSSNFVESKMSPECNSLLHGRLGPENRTIDFKSDSSCKSLEEILTHEHSVQNEQGSKRPILVCRPEQLVSENERSRAKFSAMEDRLPEDKNALEEEGENLSRTKDLSVSSNEEEEELNPLRIQQSLQKIGCNRSVKSVNTTCKQEELPCLRTSHEISGGGSPSPALRQCLSYEGFSHVLTFIEESIARTPPDCRLLYQSKSVTSAELETLTSLCNEIGSLEQEDLEICETLVLHQLQRLLQNTMNECLLPEKIGSLDVKPVRNELESYFVATWKRLSKHVLFLLEYNVSLEQEVKDMLDTLLVLKKQEQSELPNNNTRQGKDTQRLDGNGEKDEEVTNWCEDESKEESLVEKISIAGLNVNCSGFKEQKSSGRSSEPSFSSPERRSPLSRNESKKGMVPTIKSKAFWGDSDDSTSDIEAALRPQVSSSQDDEFDDFYD